LQDLTRFERPGSFFKGSGNVPLAARRQTTSNMALEEARLSDMSAHGSERRFDDVRSFSRSLGQAYVLQFATNPTLLTLTSHRGRSVSFVRICSEICCRRVNMRKLFHPVQAIQAKIENLVAEYAVNEQTDKPCHTPTDILDQAEDEILTYTACDEALEAAAGTEREVLFRTHYSYSCCPGCD
jgi:hypothetical protein